jgi:hypothetical protein
MRKCGNQRLIWLAGVILLGSGCATGYPMKVDAISRPKAAAPNAEKLISYRIDRKNSATPENSLRDKEAEKFVRTALSGRGLYEAAPGEKADMVLAIDYGMSPPRIQLKTVTEATYRNNPMELPSVPQYSGDREYHVMVVTYEKYLRLTARENQPGTEGRPAPEIWSIDVISEGESKDLRKYLPALAAASIDYVGKDTHGQKEIRLQDAKDGKEGPVEFVKKGL